MKAADCRQIQQYFFEICVFCYKKLVHFVLFCDSGDFFFLKFEIFSPIRTILVFFALLTSFIENLKTVILRKIAILAILKIRRFLVILRYYEAMKTCFLPQKTCWFQELDSAGVASPLVPSAISRRALCVRNFVAADWKIRF